MTTVVNMRDRPELRAALEAADEHDGVVRIDRRTRWGNPYSVNFVMERMNGFSP